MENTDYPPAEIDEARYLILKIIEQAIRDYISLSKSCAPVERDYYETACEFLFNDEYRINYGDEEKSLKELLEILSIELAWFRERVVKLKDKQCTLLIKKAQYDNQETGEEE